MSAAPRIPPMQIIGSDTADRIRFTAATVTGKSSPPESPPNPLLISGFGPPIVLMADRASAPASAAATATSARRLTPAFSFTMRGLPVARLDAFTIEETTSGFPPIRIPPFSI